MKLCKCGDSYANTGFSKCPSKKFPRLLLLVPYLGSDGTVNNIPVADIADPVDRAAYFKAKLNAADPADRYYPLVIDNPTSTRAASDFETLSSKKKIKIRPGIRNFSCVVVNGSPQLIGKLEGFSCSDAFGIYIVDIENNLNGAFYDEGFLDPFPVDPDTLDIIGIWAEGDVSSKVQINFDFVQDLSDSDERMIAGSDLAPANLVRIFKMGLLDIYPVFGTNTTTSVVVTLETKDGSLLSPIGDKGLVLTDFVSSTTGVASKIRNTTTNADVTITSVTVGSDGFTYTINFAAQTAGNTMVVDVKKDGRDYSAVVAEPTTL